jgi:succinate dehydrogenase / fumarate reductase cytochrome b subunit
MGWVGRTLGSSIGMKWMMAVSGLALVGFVIVHMLGNLQVFLGPEALNHYAVALREMPFQLLWILRIGLVVAFVVHVFSAVRLTDLNRAARPEAYAVKKAVASTYASRTMMMGGLILLAFIIYHLAHFTFGVTNPDHFALHDAQGRHDVYRMVVLGFRNPIVTGAYVLAMVPLAMHLSHGASSLFQSLGISHPKYDGFLRGIGPFLGTVLFVGNVSMPLAVLAGLVRLGGGH